MKTPAHDTALYLADLSGFGPFGGNVDWSVYVGREPIASDSLVNTVTVYDTGGDAPSLIPSIRRPTIQVRVRSDAYNAGWQKAHEAFTQLWRPTSVQVDGGKIISWVPQGDVTFIGRDDRDHSLFTVNFIARTEQDAA